MNDDDLLKAIGGAARDADAKAREELERLAAGDDDVARPLDDAARARITAKLLEATTAKAGPKPDAATRESASASPAKTRDDGARVVLLRRAAWVVAPLAMAAAVLLWIGRPQSLAPVPDYEVSLVGGDQTTRGAPVQLRGDTIRVRSASRVQIVARPATKPEGTVEARAFLIRGGAAQPWTVPIEVSPEGAARISGEAGAIFPEATGDWDVVVAVGRAAALPTQANVVSMLGGTTGAVRVVRCHVVVSGG